MDKTIKMNPVRVLNLKNSQIYNAWMGKELYFDRLIPKIFVKLSYSYVDYTYESGFLTVKTENLYFTTLKEFKKTYSVVR